MYTPDCVQCGKPAIASVGGKNLCVEHAATWQNAITAQQAQSLAMMNMLGNQIEDIMGVPRTQKTPPPQPVIHHGGSYTLNHVQVDRSIVGSINTAQVDQINVSLDNVTNQSEDGKEVAVALKSMTEAILGQKEIDNEIRVSLIESLAFLANQANVPVQERHPTVIKNVLNNVRETVSTIADLATVWATSAPAITSFLTQ